MGESSEGYPMGLKTADTVSFPTIRRDGVVYFSDSVAMLSIVRKRCEAMVHIICHDFFSIRLLHDNVRAISYTLDRCSSRNGDGTEEDFTGPLCCRCPYDQY